MDIGGELRRARTARTLSLEDVSRRTRISLSVLRAIEANQFEQVPRGLFARGFLRAYAREVGVDGENLVREYRAAFEPPDAPAAGGHVESADSFDTFVPDQDDEPTNSRRKHVIQVGIIAAIVLGCMAVLRYAGPGAQHLKPADAGVASFAAPVPVATSGSTVAAEPARPEVTRELKLEMRPHGPCWVDATVEGKHVVSRLMNAGEHEALTVREDLMLRVGDPAAFAFSIDGVPGVPLGQAGKPVWVRITPQNYRTFLESRR